MLRTRAHPTLSCPTHFRSLQFASLSAGVVNEFASLTAGAVAGAEGGSGGNPSAQSGSPAPTIGETVVVIEDDEESEGSLTKVYLIAKDRNGLMADIGGGGGASSTPARKCLGSKVQPNEDKLNLST